MFFLILIYLAFISLGLPDSLLGTTWPLMRLDLGVPVEYAGIISFIISGGTIISSLLSHRLIKKFGTGNITVVSVLLTALALLGFSLSNEFYFLIILAIPLGIGAGAIDAGLNKFVAENYEAKHMNWLHSFWGVGAIIGPLLISFFINMEAGWRLGYLVIAIIQFALAILLIFSLPKWYKKENGDKKLEVHLEDNHVKVKKSLLIAVLSSYFLYMFIESAIILWGATYLIEVRAFTESLAALSISLYFVGITVGRMLSGFLSIKISNNNLIKIGVTTIITGVLLLFIPNNIISVIAVVIIGLGLAPIYPALLHQTPVYFGKKNAQKMMGRQMAFAYISSTFMPPILGIVLSKASFKLLPPILLITALIFVIATLFYKTNNVALQKTETNI